MKLIWSNIDLIERLGFFNDLITMPLEPLNDDIFKWDKEIVSPWYGIDFCAGKPEFRMTIDGG